MKVCSKCGMAKSLVEFVKNRQAKDGRRGECKDCRREHQKMYRAANSEHRRAGGRAYYAKTGWERLLKGKYGLTPEDYDRILKSQLGMCANPGCFNEPSGSRLCVDHDHSCCSGERSCGQCIRGLICDPCNRAAGILRDDPKRLRGLADYLENHVPGRLTRIR